MVVESSGGNVAVRVSKCWQCPFCVGAEDDLERIICQGRSEERFVTDNLRDETPVPDWCPLREGAIAVELEAEA